MDGLTENIFGSACSGGHQTEPLRAMAQVRELIWQSVEEQESAEQAWACLTLRL